MFSIQIQDQPKMLLWKQKQWKNHAVFLTLETGSEPEQVSLPHC